jgi:hypothetical protein
MAKSRIRRQLGILLAVALLAIAMTATAGSTNRVAADPINHATCAGATNLSFNVQKAPWPVIAVGLTGRPCTDGRIAWNFSSAWPTNCYVRYSMALIIDGVCGYTGQLTTNFGYQIKIVIKNYATSVIDLGLIIAGAHPVLPAHYEYTCWIQWDYNVNGTWFNYDYCGPMSWFEY